MTPPQCTVNYASVDILMEALIRETKAEEQYRGTLSPLGSLLASTARAYF